MGPRTPDSVAQSLKTKLQNERGKPGKRAWKKARPRDGNPEESDWVDDAKFKLVVDPVDEGRIGWADDQISRMEALRDTFVLGKVSLSMNEAYGLMPSAGNFSADLRSLQNGTGQSKPAHGPADCGKE